MQTAKIFRLNHCVLIHFAEEFSSQLAVAATAIARYSFSDFSEEFLNNLKSFRLQEYLNHCILAHPVVASGSCDCSRNLKAAAKRSSSRPSPPSPPRGATRRPASIIHQNKGKGRVEKRWERRVPAATPHAEPNGTAEDWPKAKDCPAPKRGGGTGESVALSQNGYGQTNFQ